LEQVEHFDAAAVAPYLQTVRDGLPAHHNQTDLQQRGYLNVFDATELSTVRLVVTEGKHRMVRRMLANCGHGVVSLKRERLGIIQLSSEVAKGRDGSVNEDDGDDNKEELRPGEMRALTARELEWASSLLPQKTKTKERYIPKSKNKQK
jgi:16S rRNA U516 pseudouridylate synthase RsuA-like enzyme